MENYIYIVDGRRKLTEEEAKNIMLTQKLKPLQYYIKSIMK